MIQEAIGKLTAYGIATGLIDEADRTYTINRLLELFRLDEWEGTENDTDVTDWTAELEGILGEMLTYAHENGILPEDDIVHRDLFDTKIMGLLTPRPGEVIRRFRELYAQSPEKATDFY